MEESKTTMNSINTTPTAQQPCLLTATSQESAVS